MEYSILVGKNKTKELRLIGKMANRHGLIAGATGTGKSVTLKVLAEGFSAMGVPVFLADVKGDLAGTCLPGTENPKMKERVSQLGLDPLKFTGFPTTFWDVFGEQGHPVRATISDMGPVLLSRLLNLNETQAGVLSIVFRVADDNGMLLLDLKDLRAMLQFVGEHAKEYATKYGNVSTASIGAIQRGLLVIEDQGGENFFGEPALNLDDFIQTDTSGKGVINILAADKLMHQPTIYSTFLLWLLSELFERLPELGDPEKPKLVFFFDEAHLLFDEAPKALLEKIEQVVRLIRSKGVGVYFISQNPLDIPETVLGQLGNRVQHALRAFTAKDQKAVRAAAETFRANEQFETEKVITELEIGEALISLLDEKGMPGVVERAFICPPLSRMGPISNEERVVVIKNSLVFGQYETTIDRESAYEKIAKRVAQEASQETSAPAPSGPVPVRQSAPPAPAAGPARNTGSIPGSTQVQAMLTSAARSIGTQVGRQLIRGVLGTFFGGTSKRKGIY